MDPDLACDPRRVGKLVPARADEKCPILFLCHILYTRLMTFVDETSMCRGTGNKLGTTT
jgi:hypothetical protein